MAAGEHRHGVDQRPRGIVVEQVAQDEHERPPPAGDPAERQLVVAVDEPRLQVEQRPHEVPAARAARTQLDAHLGVERDDAAMVAELVGGQRDRGDRVEGRVEPAAVPERRGHQPAGVEQEHELARLLEPVLVGHRTADALGRRPVDVADVVVRRPLAHRLEVGPEPERPARPLRESSSRPSRAASASRRAVTRSG